MDITVHGVFVAGLCCLFHHMVSAEFNCTFDTNTCGWTQDKTDSVEWIRHMGFTDTRGTGPRSDHTSGNGYYMYTESPFAYTTDKKARLISPVINGMNEMCLVFYYHMYGINIETLNVYFSRNGSLGSPVWTKFQTQGRVWNRGTVQITGGATTAAVINIVFEAVQGKYVVGDIAIDDVSLQSGTCPQEPYRTIRMISPVDNGIGRIEVYHSGSWGTVCDDGFTEQAAEVACRQLGMMKTWSKPTTANVDPGSDRIWLDDISCNGNESSLAECDHSPWGNHSCSHSQDVGANCDSGGDVSVQVLAPLSSMNDMLETVGEPVRKRRHLSKKEEGLNCTFDIDTCDWKQDRRNHFNWTRSPSETPRNGNEPNSDHTSGDGSYMYIETSYPYTEERTAHFYSPPINGTPEACLVFYYYMFGLNVSDLKVYVNQIAPRFKHLWTMTKSQGKVWKKGVVQIPAVSTITRVMFEGIRGPYYNGTIAIDDVSLTRGICHEETVPLEQLEPGGATSGNSTSWNSTPAVIGGVVAVVVIAVVAVVVVYLSRRRRLRSNMKAMPQRMRSTDEMNNPVCDQGNVEPDKAIAAGIDETIQVTWSSQM